MAQTPTLTRTPTAFEQEMLEYINQARLNPADEFDLVIADAAAGTGTQGRITNAIRSFGVDIEAFRSQMAAFDPVAPLAWNEALATAADGHSQAMIDNDTQSHQLPGEAGLLDRATAAGYDDLQRVGENIFAFTSDPLFGHAGFMIDWGYDDADFDGTTLRPDFATRGDGIQDPPGHRNTILNSAWDDIGLSALEENNPGTKVGPYVVTQNFAAAFGDNPAHLLGVFIFDADADRFYDMGEGLAGLTVTVTDQATGQVTSSVTWDSGGYQVELAPGSYTVSFSGGMLRGVAQYTATVGTQNVKLDGFAADVSARSVQFADGIEGLYFADVAGQVYRLYQTVLGREPDVAGLLAWSERIAVEGRTLADVAQGFTGSPEFEARFGGQDSAGFVTLLYGNVLGRSPDAPGFATWTGVLNRAEMTRAEVVLGFSESAEFQMDTGMAARAFTLGATPSAWGDDVYRLYQATLDRAPDLNGFLNWSGRLGSGTPYLEVVEGFTQSPEFTQTYGETTNEAFVTLLYGNVLDRDPDDQGLGNWTARLDGGMSRAEAVRGFAQSAEFTTKTASALTDWVRAQGEDDMVQATAGENLLAGGMLADRFVFWPGNTTSTVLDLEPWDSIDLRAFGLTDDAAARALFSAQGVDVLFDDGQGTTVTYQQTALGDITDDMILV